MTQTGGALAATAVDFAALLEAVALDPEVVLGKAANPGTRRARAVARSTEKVSENSAQKAKSVAISSAPRVPAAKAKSAYAKGAVNPSTSKPIVASALKSAIHPQANTGEPSITGARSVAVPERVDLKASKPQTGSPTLRKPPKSLALRSPVAGRVKKNPDWPTLEPLPAALHEDLLASDTVVLGVPMMDSAARVPQSVEAKPAVQPDTEDLLRRWPGPRRKCVTVSVRLSPEDAKMLRRRANESELSISDYLRSCVLEADQLRAQVKQVLAEMRMRAPEPMPQQETREPVARRSATKSPQHQPLQDQPASQPKAQLHQPISRLQRWLAAWRGPLVAG